MASLVSFVTISQIAAGILLAVLAVIGGLFCLMWRRETRLPRILSLMYHRLGPPPACEVAAGSETTFLLPASEFAKQMAHLAERGYRFLSADEVCGFAAGSLHLDGPAVAVTFDDGCRSSAEYGIPVLREYGGRATLFVTTDPAAFVFHAEPIDPRLSDDAIRALDRELLQVGSHGVTHEPLSGMSTSEIREELSKSKETLERITGAPVRHFAVPGNWYDRRVLRIAREVGYDSVWCSRPGATLAGAHRYGLPRINIDGYMTLQQFEAQLRPFGIAKRRFLLALRSAPGRLLGPRIWWPLRQAIMRCIPGGHLSMRAAAIATIVIVLATLLLSLYLSQG